MAKMGTNWDDFMKLNKPDSQVLITEEFLSECSTYEGGFSFTKTQLNILGIEWPAPNGWKKRIIQDKFVISKSQAEIILKIGKEKREKKRKKKDEELHVILKQKWDLLYHKVYHKGGIGMLNEWVYRMEKHLD
jgi:hypothetical protein